MSWRKNPNPTIKPPFGSYIDWSHPLAEGLVGCWLFNEGTGYALNNLCDNNHVDTSGNSAIFDGGSIKIDSVSLTPPAILITDALAKATFQDHIIVAQYATTDINDGDIIGNNIYASGGLLLQHDVNGYIKGHICDNNSAITSVIGTKYIRTSNFKQVAQVVIGNELSVWVDGEKDASVGISVRTMQDVNLYLAGRQASSGNNTDCYLEYLYIYAGEKLNTDVLPCIKDEPYTFIAWSSRRVIFDFGASPSVIGVSDTLSASDAINAIAHYSVSVSDGFTSADAVDPIASYLASITDALNTADTVSPARALLASVSDSVTFSDSTSALLALVAAAADALDISESIAVKAALVAILADNLDLSDITEYAGSAVASVMDTLQVSDSTGVLASLIAAASEGLTLSDVLLAGVTTALSDSAEYSDSANAIGHFVTSLVEQLNFVDSADYISGLAIAVSDGLNLADSASAVGHFVVNVSDELSISESTSVLARYLATIADSLTLSDVVRIDSDLAKGVVTISFSARPPAITFGAKAPGITFKVRK